MMSLEVSYSEALDKWTILQLKTSRLPSAVAREAVKEDLEAIQRVWAEHDLPAPESLPDFACLGEVNTQLWEVEDALRRHEQALDFGDAFVALARSVYHLNDRRSALKRALDEALGSKRTEWKSYQASEEG